jgi:hypothetical protein
MASLLIELPYSYSKEEIATWLADRKLVHMPGNRHFGHYICTGDALRAHNGTIARVVDTCRNEVGEPFIRIANNKLSKEQMDELFDTYTFTVNLSQKDKQWLANKDLDTLQQEAVGFKGYYYTDNAGNSAHTWDFEESLGE